MEWIKEMAKNGNLKIVNTHILNRKEKYPVITKSIDDIGKWI